MRRVSTGRATPPTDRCLKKDARLASSHALKLLAQLPKVSQHLLKSIIDGLLPVAWSMVGS